MDQGGCEQFKYRDAENVDNSGDVASLPWLHTASFTRPSIMTSTITTTKAREIRAVYNDNTITVYQAYNSSIARAAVEQQRLDASPLFLPGRMTWVKPSWNWMMYRAGYSYKDANQSNILALKIKRDYFHKMLMSSVLSEDENTRKGRGQVRVQWDPERNVRIGRLVNDGSVRSIQIGIPREMVTEWVRDGIVEIEDVTDRARELKRVLDEEKDVTMAALIERELVPEERVYMLPEEVAKVVGITN